MLIFEGGLSPNYVFDEMEIYEIPMFIEGLQMKNKESWEQTRFIGYITAQVNSTKKIKLQDIIKFPWESQSLDKYDNSVLITNDDVKRLHDKAKKYEMMLAKNGI